MKYYCIHCKYSSEIRKTIRLHVRTHVRPSKKYMQEVDLSSQYEVKE